MIEYIKGDLLASTDKYLLHACNCKGVWGSGVAKQFKENFPTAFEEYKEACKTAKPGDYLLCSPGRGKQVICLFTSDGYGEQKDSSLSILRATKQSLEALLAKENITSPISLPKINSGLFNVKWEATLIVLDYILGRQYPALKLNVYSPQFTVFIDKNKDRGVGVEYAVCPVDDANYWFDSFKLKREAVSYIMKQGFILQG